MVWMCLAPVVHVQPCGRLRKLYSRVTAVVNHAYYENRDTSGHLRLDLVYRISTGNRKACWTLVRRAEVDGRLSKGDYACEMPFGVPIGFFRRAEI